MKIEFDIRLTEKDLYRFNLFQTYTTSQGIISILIAILGAVMSVTSFVQGNLSYGFLYLAFAIILGAYVPISLKGRVKLTLKNNAVLAGTLHYELSEQGVKVVSGSDSGELPWKQIYKMISTKHNVLIYSGRVNAYVVPKDQLGDKYPEVKALAEKMLEKHRVNLK